MKSILNKFVLKKNLKIKDALNLFNKNGLGISFILNKKKLIGILTEGDVRRSLLKGFNLETGLTNIMNKSYLSLNVNSTDQKIRNLFSRRIKFIPLVDDKGNLVDIADYRKNRQIPISQPKFFGKEYDYVKDCLDTNWISSQGKYVKLFENKFQELYPGMNALAVSNGTVALHLSLLALGIGRNDEVIIPNITFAATANAVIYCSAKPVLCEIDENSWCIDIKHIEKLITKRTKAILPVHLYGNACNMDKLKSLAKKNNLFLIEDCAEAIGTTWKKKPVGCYGDASTFSFFGNKTLSTGEGGMVLFRDAEIANKARVMRDHGMNPNKKYWHDVVGFNYRLTNIQSAIGVAQLENLNKIIKKKAEIMNIYSSFFKKIPSIAKIPDYNKYIFHSNWLYTLILDKRIERDEVLEELMYYGIESRPMFYPLHLMKPYKVFKHSKSLRKSEFISSKGISLPSSVNLNKDKIKYIAKCLIKILKYLNEKS